MPRRYAALAWTAAALTYLLIVLGAVVRITGSGMGCGDDWPLCNGRLIPPLADAATMIEWMHRLVAAGVSLLVFGLGVLTWRLRQDAGYGMRDAATPRPSRAAYVALGLLVVQVLLGAVTVKLALPHWTVVLHFATALLLLAALLVAAKGVRLSLREQLGLGLAFATLLLGALTAKLGAASACLGFPLCNGQLVPAGNYLQHLHWAHRLLAYGLVIYVGIWAARERRTSGPKVVLVLVGLQVAVAAAMVLGALPAILRAAHVAVGVAVWAAMVFAVQGRRAPSGTDAVRAPAPLGTGLDARPAR